MNQKNLELILVVDGANGVYTGQIMFHTLRALNQVAIENLPYWAYKALEEGPENEHYLDACDEMNKLEVLYEGNFYNPYQDEDYWLVPINYEWPE